MAESYNFLEGTQTDINRRLLRKIDALENGDAGENTRIAALETAIGKAEGTGASGILKDVKDCKDAIGASDTASGSLKKRCADIEGAIGADNTEGTVKYRVKTVEDAIGTESTEGTILARIKALEDAQPSSNEPSG